MDQLSSSRLATLPKARPRLLELPNELLFAIAERIGCRSLSRLARSSRELAAVLEPYLYVRDLNEAVWALPFGLSTGSLNTIRKALTARLTMQPARPHECFRCKRLQTLCACLAWLLIEPLEYYYNQLYPTMNVCSECVYREIETARFVRKPSAEICAAISAECFDIAQCFQKRGCRLYLDFDLFMIGLTNGLPKTCRMMLQIGVDPSWWNRPWTSKWSDELHPPKSSAVHEAVVKAAPELTASLLTALPALKEFRQLTSALLGLLILEWEPSMVRPALQQTLCLLNCSVQAKSLFLQNIESSIIPDGVHQFYTGSDDKYGDFLIRTYGVNHPNAAIRLIFEEWEVPSLDEFNTQVQMMYDYLREERQNARTSPDAKSIPPRPVESRFPRLGSRYWMPCFVPTDTFRGSDTPWESATTPQRLTGRQEAKRTQTERKLGIFLGKYAMEACSGTMASILAASIVATEQSYYDHEFHTRPVKTFDLPCLNSDLQYRRGEFECQYCYAVVDLAAVSVHSLQAFCEVCVSTQVEKDRECRYHEALIEASNVNLRKRNRPSVHTASWEDVPPVKMTRPAKRRRRG